jgi:hypothetical protein
MRINYISCNTSKNNLNSNQNKQKKSSLSFGYDREANQELKKHAKKTSYEYQIRTLQNMCNKLETKIIEDENKSSINVDDVGIFVNLKAALSSIAENTTEEVNFTQKEHDHYTNEQKKIDQFMSNSSNTSDDISVPEEFDSENVKNWRRIVASVIIAPFASNEEIIVEENNNTKIEQIADYNPPPYKIERNEINIFE